MLTRLKVSGFKNLQDVDVQFGLFTCIAGANGVGKSNLFDVITFLSDLASMPIIKACSNIRGTHGRTSDFSSIFSSAKDQTGWRIELVAEIIVPRRTFDDFDREATPTATLLEYTLILKLNTETGSHTTKDPISIEKEELRAKPSSEAHKYLEFFGGSEIAKDKSIIFGPGSRNSPFIQTIVDEGETTILLYGDKGGGRNPLRISARKSPQTVLSGVNLSSHPTALAVRREMQSWRMLQLEPSALRAPDEIFSDSVVSATGQHLPNAIFRLGENSDIANRLSELIPGVVMINVQTDETRQQRMLSVTMDDRKAYAASSLSDGTLRFLALAVLSADPESIGLICLEEPENGIHPLRIPEMLNLVRDLSDVGFSKHELSEQNGLRQVIINTHSPLVVAELPDDELLMAEAVRKKGFSFINFKPLYGTWRAKSLSPNDGALISRGELHAYLSGQKINSSLIVGKKRVKQHLDSDDLDMFR